MEVEGVKRIFERNEEKHKLLYTEYYGDGDSKGVIITKECVGHVQERVGTVLCKLKKEKKKFGWQAYAYRCNDKQTAKLLEVMLETFAE